MDDIEINNFNYARAEHLNLISIEFAWLVGAMIFFLRIRNRSLTHLYLISLPYTDKIYRIFDVQPSEIIALVLIAFNFKYILGKLKSLYIIIPFLVLGSLIGVYRSGSLFSALYSIRLIIILCLVNIFSHSKFKFDWIFEGLNIFRVMLFVSIGVAISQAFFWMLGFNIAGVFFQEGFLRVKGLAHEPSTFSVWIALAIPFIICYHNIVNKNKFSIFISSIMVIIGLILTSSLLGLIMLAVFWIAIIIFKAYYQGIAIFFKKIFFIPIIIFLLLTFIVPKHIIDYLDDKVHNVVLEFTDASFEDRSGRGGDRLLTKLWDDNLVLGIGAFRSSKLNEKNSLDDIYFDDYIPAANFFITTITEFGLLGFSGFCIWGMFIYLQIRKKIHEYNIPIICGVFAWLVGLLGSRLIAFQLPWILIFYMTIPAVKYINSEKY
jgi:hypothetical protein